MPAPYYKNHDRPSSSTSYRRRSRSRSPRYDRDRDDRYDDRSGGSTARVSTSRRNDDDRQHPPPRSMNGSARDRERERSPVGRSARDDSAYDQSSSSRREDGRDNGGRRKAEQQNPGWGKPDSPPTRRRSSSRSRSRSPGRPSLQHPRRALDSQDEVMKRDGVDTRGRRNEADGTIGQTVKAVEPNFALSGALAAETNTLRGVVLKYHEPPEARKPVKSWRLYVFKGKEQLDIIHVHRQSAYLFGRDRIVADIPIDHPSSSKQHAVLQFRQVHERNEFGDTKSIVKPFIIDLDSANGTMVNDETVPKQRFYELITGDVLKFAWSSREYVLLAE